MRKLAMLFVGAIALSFVAMFAWQSDAAPLTGAITLPTINDSIVEKVACGRRRLFARCRLGYRWDRYRGQCVACYVPPPAYYGPVSYAPPPWTPEWYAYCASRYRSFNPRTGYFIGDDGYPQFCR